MASGNLEIFDLYICTYFDILVNMKNERFYLITEELTQDLLNSNLNYTVMPGYKVPRYKWTSQQRGFSNKNFLSS